MLPQTFEEPQVLVEALLDELGVRLGAPLRARALDLTQDRSKLGEGAAEDLLEGVVLGLEVKIERTLGQPRRARDVLYLGAVEPMLDEDVACCFEQTAAGTGVTGAGHAKSVTDGSVTTESITHVLAASSAGAAFPWALARPPERLQL